MKLQACIVDVSGCGWFCYADGKFLNDVKKKLIGKLHYEFSKKEKMQKYAGIFAKKIYYPSTIKVKEIVQRKDDKRGWITKRGGIKLKLKKRWIRGTYSDGNIKEFIGYVFLKN